MTPMRHALSVTELKTRILITSDEPIVITRLKLHQGDQEVCINCYWDMVEVANTSDASIMDIATEKLNVMRLLSKQASPNAPTS